MPFHEQFETTVSSIRDRRYSIENDTETNDRQYGEETLTAVLHTCDRIDRARTVLMRVYIQIKKHRVCAYRFYRRIINVMTRVRVTITIISRRNYFSRLFYRKNTARTVVRFSSNKKITDAGSPQNTDRVIERYVESYGTYKIYNTKNVTQNA